MAVRAAAPVASSSPAASSTTTPPPLRRLLDVDGVLFDPPTPPLALGQGYAAARAGQPQATNPYSLGLPTDDESQAQLWNDGFHVGRRHPPLN